jgi:hypothetical protein
MRRFRLSTLMLLVVIAALCVALVGQQQRAARQHDRAVRREAELQARLAQSWPLFLKQQQRKDINASMEVMARQYRARLAKRGEWDASLPPSKDWGGDRR